MSGILAVMNVDVLIRTYQMEMEIATDVGGYILSIVSLSGILVTGELERKLRWRLFLRLPWIYIVANAAPDTFGFLRLKLFNFASTYYQISTVATRPNF